MSKRPTVICGLCRHEGLPIDYLKCPECGQGNPQLHLVQRKLVKVFLENSVLRPIEKLAIKTGRPKDDLICEAIEYWLGAVNQGKVRVE